MWIVRIALDRVRGRATPLSGNGRITLASQQSRESLATRDWAAPCCALIFHGLALLHFSSARLVPKILAHRCGQSRTCQ